MTCVAIVGCAGVQRLGGSSEARKWLTRGKCAVSAEQPVLVLQDNGVVDPTLFVRRRGQDHWLFEYPLWDRGDGLLTFRFDSQLFNAKSGRYEAELRTDCKVCQRFELIIDGPCATNAKIVCPEGADRLLLHRTKPEGLNVVVFDTVQNFSATFCRELTKDDDALPLLEADRAFLCGLTLCKAVELVVSDGYKTETVLFSGCQAGEVVVDRAQSGTVLNRFPRGAKVQFSWTAANVTAECEGC